MAVLAAAAVPSLVFSSAFLWQGSGSVGEFILGAIFVIGISYVIALLVTFFLTFLPFEATMGLFGKYLHRSATLCSVAGALLGGALMLFLGMLLSTGSNMGNSSKPSIEFLAIWMGLGLLSGAVGGITYSYFSKRDSQWPHPYLTAQSDQRLDP